MTGASVTITPADNAALAQLQGLASGVDATSLMHRLGEYFQESTQKRFDTQTDPQGVAWAPLSKGYIKRKKKNKALVLTLNAYLRREIHDQVLGQDTVAWGSNSVYAAIHNLGGDGTGHNASMPQRQFLGISTVDEAEALEISRDWIHRKIHGLPD